MYKGRGLRKFREKQNGDGMVFRVKGFFASVCRRHAGVRGPGSGVQGGGKVEGNIVV